MRIVLALGGNALLRRGERFAVENQLNNIKRAAAQIAKLAPGNELIITHGNGPQIGLLALQNDAYHLAEAFPLDVLDAETEGMIGYLLEQEIANFLGETRMVATLLTRVEVDPGDYAFKHLTKPIGPVYSKREIMRIAQSKQWAIVQQGSGFRRVVASPKPKHILGVAAILWLLEHDVIVIAAGGGGIPVVRAENSHEYKGVEGVIDKDYCSALLAKQLVSDYLLIATDVDAVYLDWGKNTQRPIKKISPKELLNMNFPDGSMGPKVKAACQFVVETQKTAIIGSLDTIDEMMQGLAGTQIMI